MKTVVCLNGPPRSGKDTLAKMFEENCVATRHCENKEALMRLALEISGVSKSEWYERYNSKLQVLPSSTALWKKDLPWYLLPYNKKTGDCFSQRDFLIYISENVMKPHFGNDYFGQKSAHLVIHDKENDTFAFSDGGFPEELEVMFQYPEIKVVLVRLHRKDCDFSKDSRDYLFLPEGCDEKHTEADIFVGENQIEKAFDQIYDLVF